MRWKRNRYWPVWAGLAVALALGLGLATSQSRRGADTDKGRGASGPLDGRQTGVSARGAAADFAGEARPSRGPADAPVTVVEFTDYQCPFCMRHFRQTYPLLLREYGDRVRYVVRNFPVIQNSAKAAEAAECAFDQGKFWDYHDRLFAGDRSLDRETLERYAEEVGLDKALFNECLESGRKSPVVRRDIEDGRRFGVGGTPAFFINGRVLIGAQPFEVFQYYIEEALREASAE